MPLVAAEKGAQMIVARPFAGIFRAGLRPGMPDRSLQTGKKVAYLISRPDIANLRP